MAIARESGRRYRPADPGPDGERSQGAKATPRTQKVLFCGHGKLKISKIQRKDGPVIRIDLELD